MLLSPNPPTAPRISQLLPTVKCSNCNQPVPLAELGEHVCPPTPPVPVVSPPRTTSTISQRRGNDSLRLGSVSTEQSRRSGYKPKATSPLREHNSSLSISSLSSTSSTSRARSISSTSSNRRPSVSSMRRPSVSSMSSSSSVSPPTQSLPPLPSLPSTPKLPPQLPSTPKSPPQIPSTPRSPPQFPFPRSTSQVPFTPKSPQTPSRTATPIGLPSSPSSVSIPPPRSMPASPPARFPVSHQHAPSFASVNISNRSEPDTKIGGEAGMAGVGRRGFAAVAQAALFIAPHQSLQGGLRRPYAPQFLDIDAATRTTSTPPLTASSLHSNGPVSPLSPLSQRIPSPVSPIKTVPSDLPPLHDHDPVPRLPSPPYPDTPRANTPSRSLSKSTTTSSNSASRISKASKRQSARSDASSDSEYGLAYADSTDYEDNDNDNENEDEKEGEQEDRANKSRHVSGRSSYGALLKSRAEPPPPLPSIGGSILQNGLRNRSSSSSSGSDYSDKEPTPTARPSHARQSSSAKIAQALGLSQKSPGAYASGRLGGPGGPGRTPSRDGTGLEKETDDLLKEVDAPLSSSPTQVMFDKFDASVEARTGSRPSQPGTHRSNTVANTGTRKSSQDSIAAKLPTRANTERAGSNSTSREKERKKRVKVCLRCETAVPDGKWIKMDNGGGLCERCWKNMYLPKCRRCNKPIEKQAVSSSDGQLKGKYHKDCFNCATCHKPFPNKTFYIFDGKPLCAYHYAEANDSLCAAATCGQPIEGPCAVSHAGDRYHPEHLLCEYPSGIPGKQGCTEKLEEYWEVDGRMLCERHANVMIRRAGDSDLDDDEQPVMGSKAMKRTTRFIDLNLGLDGGLGASGLR